MISRNLISRYQIKQETAHKKIKQETINCQLMKLNSNYSTLITVLKKNVDNWSNSRLSLNCFSPIKIKLKPK